MSDFNRNELKNKTLAEFRPAKSDASSHLTENHNEDYDEEDDSSFFDKFKLIVPIIVIAIICFISYAWYTDKFAISNSDASLKVIKANKEPLREKPEDPGGMKIVNRDKRVYDAISGKDDEKDTKSVNILPAPEEPMAHEEIVKNESTSEVVNKPVENDKTSVNSVNSEIIKDEVAKTTPKAEINNSTKSAVLPPIKENTVIALEKDNQEEVKLSQTIESKAIIEASSGVSLDKAKAEAPKEKVKAVTADDITDIEPKKQVAPQKKVTKADPGYRVQLGSYRSKGDAEASWKIMKKKFSDILNGLNDYIEKADLGDKGVYYRLQLSGFKDESDARKVCQKLTVQKQGCFFVGK